MWTSVLASGRPIGTVAEMPADGSSSTTGPYVSEPIVVWSCDGNSNFQKATDTDIADLKRFIQAWETLERETLRFIYFADAKDPGIGMLGIA